MVRGSQRVNQTAQGYHAMQHGGIGTRSPPIGSRVCGDMWCLSALPRVTLDPLSSRG
jgi:hypothetical protein